MEKPPSPGRIKLGLLLENFWLAIRRQRSYSDLVSYPVVLQQERSAYRSIKLRHLDCGSCHGCELSLLRLENPVFDIEQFNVAFTASPKHAYFLVMTGPLTLNIVEAARAALAQMPVEAVIAFGDCAVDGGIFNKSYAVLPRAEVFPDEIVFRTIRGCPPNPLQAQRILLQSGKDDSA